jgi:dienelactone hydrolase
MTTITAGVRFRDQAITFANGAKGRVIEVPSASPRNYHQAISAPAEMPRVTIDGQLFLPSGASGAARLPLVIVVPGSLGVAPVHLTHAETLTSAGLAAFVLDPFGARGVTSTVSNQTQYSFAASAYDVLAAWQVLAQVPEIEAARIGAQGHSRGGAAVLTAATRRFADAVVGRGRGLSAVLGAYPWSGHQFLDPSVGPTRVRVLMGDRDEWCSLQQVQGHLQAMRLAGGTVSLRVFSGAAHSFDRGTAVVRIDDAAVAPGAPTTYLADDGSCIHPITGQGDPTLTDRDVAVYGLKAGYGVRGASLGGTAAEAAEFRDDMRAFWTAALRG